MTLLAKIRKEVEWYDSDEASDLREGAWLEFFESLDDWRELIQEVDRLREATSQS